MIGNRGRLFLAACFSISSLGANALMVTIEPDDYAIGTDLTHISPYVDLYRVETFALKPTSYREPITSRLVSGYNNNEINPPAPTGDQTFGNFGYGYTGGYAFGIFFNTEVSNLTLLANNMYPHGVSTYWRALDADGIVLASGGAGYGVPSGENFEVKVNVQNMAALILGADDGSHTTRFDRLTFQVDDRYAQVPEPGALVLLGAGVVGVVVTRRRKDGVA